MLKKVSRGDAETQRNERSISRKGAKLAKAGTSVLLVLFIDRFLTRTFILVRYSTPFRVGKRRGRKGYWLRIAPPVHAGGYSD
jgi:hypothetical protein